MKYLLFLSISLLLLNCQSIKKTSANAKDVAVEHFGQGVEVRFNSTNNFALFVSDNKQKSLPAQTLDYAIYDVGAAKIIFEEQKRGGTVDWFNDEFIVVNSMSEVQSIDREQNKKMSVYYINVKTLKKAYNIEE